MSPSNDSRHFPSDEYAQDALFPLVGPVKDNFRVVDLPQVPYRVLGNFPYEKFFAGEDLGIKGSKTWWVEIYPLIENPELCGMVAQEKCVHSDAHKIYLDGLRAEAAGRGESDSDLSRYQALATNYIDAFIRFEDSKFFVELRPKNGKEELTLRAMDLLKSYGFADEQILFICEEDESSNFECIANLGMLHRVKLLPLSNPEEVSKYIESHSITSETGVNYLYRQGKGIRYITPDEIKALHTSIDDPDVFKAKINEIYRLTSRDEKAIGKRHADFMLVKNHRILEPGSAFREEFGTFHNFVQNINKSDWPDRKSEVILGLNKFYSLMVNETQDLFRSDAPHDNQWAFFIARILIGKTYDSKGLDLGKQFLGVTSHLPGGMLGYKEPNGILHYGPEVFDSIQDVQSRYKRILGAIHGHNCNQLRQGKTLFFSPSDINDSVVAFVPSSELHSRHRINVLQYEFHPETDERTKAMMNIALEDHVKLSNSFVSQIKISRDRRDPEPDLIGVYGADSHDVLVRGVTIQKNVGNEMLFTRTDRLGYNSHQIAGTTIHGHEITPGMAEVISNVHLQFKQLQALGLSNSMFPGGPGTPLLTARLLPVEIDGKMTPIQHVEREFFHGASLHTLTRVQGDMSPLTMEFARAIGKQIAYDIFSRRRNHRDGDEIAQFIGDKLNVIYLASARSAFPPPYKSNAGKYYSASLNLIASHLGADLAARVWLEKNQANLSLPSSSELLNQAMLTTKETLLEIKDRVRKHGQDLYDLVANEFNYDDLAIMEEKFGKHSPVVEIMDFPACFKKSLDDICDLNVEDLTLKLKIKSVELSSFYERVISGIDRPAQVDQILKHTESLFGSNSWYTDYPVTHHKLMKPVQDDSWWMTYSAEERLQLISTLRVSAWMQKMSAATKDESLDLRSIVNTAVQIRREPLKRHEAIKMFNESLVSRSPIISLSSDTIAYFYSAVTSSRMGRDNLEDLGYLVYG